MVPTLPVCCHSLPHVLSHTLTITCTCAWCYVEIKGTQDNKISHAHSLILSIRRCPYSLIALQAYRRWVQIPLMQRHRENMVCRGLGHWVGLQWRAGWNCWSDSSIDRLFQMRILRAACCRMASRAVQLGWNAWRDETANQLHRTGMMIAAAACMEHRYLTHLGYSPFMRSCISLSTSMSLLVGTDHQP